MFIKAQKQPSSTLSVNTYTRQSRPSEIYVKQYVQWNNLPNNAYFIFTKIDNFKDPRIIAGAYIYQHDGILSWGMEQNNGANYVNSALATGAKPNTWYCIELYVKCSTGAGHYDGATKMWITDLSTGVTTELKDIAQSNLNTGSTTVVDTIVEGQMEPSYTVINYIDNVVISRSYIGA